MLHSASIENSFSYQVLSIFSNIILSDPSAYEEEMCGGIGANLIVCCNQGVLCGIQKFCGSNLTSESQDEALKIAKLRAKIVEEVIDACIKNYKTV